MVFHALVYHIDMACLEKSLRKLRREAALGIDNRSYSDYEQYLSAKFMLCTSALEYKNFNDPIRSGVRNAFK